MLGTERHESRRIDNQLRGRSGRQGDPGRSKFFLSLEDDLMRIFGSDKLDGMLTKLGLKEDEAIVHPWINKALEKAQQKVEARNFDIRKNILKFDNVMNDQRKVIFDQRIELMRDENVAETVSDMRHAVIDDLVAKHVPENAYPEQWDTPGLKTELERVLGLDLPVEEWAKEEGIADEEIIARIEKRADEHMAGKVGQWGPDVIRYVEKSILLQTLDHLWREHLLMLEHLRQVIGLRGYGQRDPLNEYKSESFNLFEAMIAKLREAVTAQLMRVEIVQQPSEQEQQNLPYMEAHKIDPDHRRGRVRLCGRAARAGLCRKRQRHRARRQSERSDDLGQGRPQRGLPVRLRQEVQALPRAVRVAVTNSAVIPEAAQRLSGTHLISCAYGQMDPGSRGLRPLGRDDNARLADRAPARVEAAGRHGRRSTGHQARTARAGLARGRRRGSSLRGLRRFGCLRRGLWLGSRCGRGLRAHRRLRRGSRRCGLGGGRRRRLAVLITEQAAG